MAIYIYRGGGCGGPGRGPGNPLVRAIISFLIIVAVVGIGIALLPVLGVVALVILGLIAALVIGGMIYRWIYGDPWEQMLKKAQNMQEQQSTQDAPSKTSGSGRFKSKTRWGSQNSDIEDAVVVDERKKSQE